MTLEALENRVLLTVTGFQSAVNYTSGSGPHAVATGDFTNNGRSDLVVVNQTSGTVSVFLSNPNGTLQATATTLTDNAAPDAVAVGDFLDNGDEDIAVANHSNGTVSVWLGNGNGSFSAPATYSVGAGADAIASADLNGDGRDDLAVGTFTAGNVVVLLANSNGTTAANAFSISGTYSLGAGINGIAAGETSTDGFNDLAVSNVGGTVTVLHNNGSGQFTTSNSDVYNAGISPAGVVIGNFQEAGDIAVADNGDGTSGSANVTVLLNTDGTGDDYATDSSGPYLAGANPNSIVAANINGDGRMDLAVTDDTDNTISLLYNNNTGSGPIFAAPVTVATGTAPDSIAAGDFTGSGQVDLAVANKSSGNASVFLHSSISATGIAQTATEGTTLSGTTVATFTDNEANASAGDFTAQVNWGDGTTTTGSVSSANGSFYVTASHAYYDQGSYTVTVAVSDTNDDSAQATASATVADAALTATALTIAPTAGASFTGPVATFTDADPNGAAKFQNDPNQYAAIIAWGDGHSTAGVITDNSGTFDVSGTHTYTIYGTFSPHVTIEDEGGSTIAVTSTANVADAAIAASGTSITATEGGSFSGTIGTFTDANPFMGAGAFTATLHWGDGTTTTGTVINTGTGQFSITGTHTYGDAGSNTLSFTVSDLGGSSNSSSTSVQVNNATLGSALATINATEGTSYTSTVATFTDSNTSASANKFTALITWPDLTTSSGTVSGSGGSYAVTIPGGHTFAHAGSQAVSVLITGAGGSTTTASGNTTVANAAMAGTLATVTATEGTPFTGTLATFTDANTAAAAADFSSTITWDNNSTSSGTIVATGTPGTYAVTIPGGHTFTRTGSRAISIAISGAGDGTASASGNVTVDNQTITATASTISASNGNQFSGAVATFSDPNLGANHLDFSASINWGDTTTSAGIVHWVSPGNFVVDGTHTWANPGTPTVAVTITGAGGGSQGTSQNATVTDSPVSVTATANSVTEGQTFNGTIATFTDGNPSAVVGNFSSSIDWGDSSGADTSATITESNGVFSVVGTHAYSGAGTPTVSVSVTDNNSQTVTNGATMTVGYASVGATLATISATEGSAFSDTVATFTDANTSAPANQFLATIHWPGGSSTTGTIAQTSPGNFSVTGGFTFARAGSRPVSVDITDPTGVTSLATASGNATVTSAGVTVTGSSFEALQGFGRTGTVATFADAYSGSITPASAYSATITWDDSTTSPGTITSTGSGTYSITAGHIWETAGNGINYSISVTGPGMGSAATGTGTVAVDSRDLVATMSTITATEGTPFTGTVATFANNDTLALNPGTDYTATITWDDNTTSVGTVTALSGGEYSVTSTHTFNTPGIPTQSISITGPRVFSAVTASGAATVANAGVTVSAGSIAPTEGAPFTGTIGTFTDANTNTTGSAGSYTAAITWDDDTTDDATITALSNGAYSITDTHTFNDPGSQSYSISVSGPGMSTAATGTGSAAVVNAGISGTLSTITATEGSNWSGTVATFTDANSSSVGSPDGYVATITWDDNTTSPGVVSPIGQSGAYSITSNHTFQTPGSAAVSISVAGTYNGLASPASISGNATVQAATLDVTAAAPLAFTEGAADTNVTVATFTTADPSRVLGDFAATVNWGDNTGTDSGTTIVSLGNETYAVVATGHTYAQASSVPYQFTVNVTEGNSYQTQSDTGSADVAYATISNPTISTITATEGTPWTGTIGTFTDSNTSATISEFQATITWADETQSSAGITQTSPGNFAVTINGHAFPDAGYSAVSIAILDDGGNQLSSDSDSVYIDNATVAVTGKTLSATSGNLFSGAIASFTDSNTLATSADFTATINWGDTTTSSGTAVTISQTSPGNFNVIAAHTFAPSNPYTITITVDGAGGAVESDTSSMTVADAPIAVTGNSVEATEASAYSGTIATFIDTDSTLNASNFASSIDWGDNTGADTSATITEVDSQTGLYAVVGTHTFDSAATFIPTVSVTHTTTVTSNSGAASVDVGYATIGSTLSTIAATEGTPWSGTVATFTDSNTAAPIGEFAATINWPGGVSTSTGTISSLGNGEYAVTASGHTFNRAGARPISVDITDSGDTTTLSTASGTAAITSAGVTVTGGSINATQGADFTGTVGTFSDSYTSTTTPANAYTATITWDNTSSTTGTVTSLGNGQYSIAADHTFQTAGDVSYSISVAGPGMAESAADTGAANVTSAAVTATIAPVSTTEGTPWSGTIATFSNADSSALNAGSDYTATITWDSTSSTTGTVTSLGNGEYAVTSTHTFNNPGTPTESISIAGPGLGAAATASSTATIANAGVTVSGGSITATQGQSFTSTVGTLSDSNINTTGPANAYAATITWASGSTSAGTITSLGGGTYSISATDTLQKGGLQSYAISVTGPGMASAATGTGSVTVTNAGISSGAFGISATEGSAFSGAVVSFTNNDTSATDLGTDYSASIHWGDGIITTGTVAATGNGGYTISGSHQYDTAGSSTPMFVVVAGAGLASPVTINGTANVASAGVTATLATMTSTEGQVFSSTVATFTDADPNTTTPASSYAATITWPGNVTSSGTITAGTSGSYTVTGSNTFNHAGPQPVSISITGPGMASPATASGNASISTAGLAATLSTITASEGGTFTGTLATFTDADANTTSITSDYSAAVAWNGGNPVAGTIVALGNGQFAVTGSETFTAAGTPTVGISITGPGGGLAFASGSASVSSGTLSAAASPITAAEGVAYSGTIATFSDAYTGTTTPANAFTATITWGDNASSTGTVTSLGNGQFAITSAHTYTAPGSPTVGVSITGPGSGSATASTTATVSAAAITASTASISSTEGLTWSGTVATIHSADAASTVTAGQYSATITWPDNTQSSGTVTAQGGGVYTVAGSFAFHTAGSQTVQVAITGPGTTSAAATDTATIASAGISATLAPISGTEGTPFTGTVATFTDADPLTTTPASAYSATITWPGGTTSGTITTGTNGSYTVTGSNTFNSAGLQPVSISITGPGGAAATASGSAGISSAGLTGTLATISTTEGSAFSGTVATFTDADVNTTSQPGDYTALISWAGGAPVHGTVTSLGNGAFTVSGSYTFTAAGTPSVTVSITGPASGLAYAAGTATVASGSLSASAGAITAAEGVSSVGTIATFSDSYTATTTPASAFSATIYWGDGFSMPGVVTSIGNGQFAVGGGHIYTAPGEYTVDVDVTGPGSGLATTSTSATVSPAAITAANAAITGTEGVAWTGTVATIHSADPISTTPGQAYSATITWPDNSQSSGTVTSQGNGVYTVAGSFVFNTTGSQTVQVAITGPGTTSAAATDTAVIASAGITATLAPITSAEGALFSGTVATFTDANPDTTTLASAYTATITWPGNITSAGTITSGTNGSYTVTGSNTFNAAGSQPVSISITGPGGAAATATGNAGISSAGLSATLGTITAAEGGTFTGTVATFTDTNSATTSPANAYTALISWAGGSPVTGTITSLGNGVFAVTSSYTFTAAGTPTVAVDITGPASGLAYAAGTATVTSGTLTAAPVAVTATEGTAFSGTVATFTDAYTATTSPASAFTATVNWGDTTTSTGTVTSLGNGQFAVTSSHTYSAPSHPTVTISIAGPGNGSATTHATATVAAATLTATPSTIAATQGTAWTGKVATISIADLNTTVLAGSLAATITWPDSSTSSGTITAAGGGKYNVFGSFTFANVGAQTVSVAITGPGNTSAHVNDTATVAGSGILATLTQVTATEGTGWTGQIAKFTTSNAGATASQFAATITWEDNTTTTGTILPDSAGGFDIEASHTFANAGFAPISVSITGPNNTTGSVSGFEKVSSATLGFGVQALAANPVEGVAYTGTVATFTDSNTLATPNTFTATVSWPDGSTSAGTIAAGASPGSFVVTSPHVFAHGGSYSLHVTVTSASGTTVSTTQPVYIANNTLASTGDTVNSVAGAAFAGTVATFSDTNIAAYSTDFIAAVNYGDGTPQVLGTIASLGNGKFAVISSHTFTRYGSYPMSVSISGAGGGTSLAAGTATITNASLASSGKTLTEHKGVGFTTQIGILYSANPYLRLSDMSGTVNWGDKTSSSAILQAGTGGSYQILGSHTYAALGNFNVAISLKEAGGGATSVTSFVTVNTTVSSKPPKVGKTPKPKKVKAPKKVKTTKVKKSDKDTDLPLAA